MMRRLLGGLGGNLYAQGVTVVVQLLTVPGFTHAWGGSLFGRWLMLSAATAVLSMTDCGVTVTSGTAMTMAVARRDLAAANRLWAQASRFVAWVALSLGVIVLAGAAGASVVQGPGPIGDDGLLPAGVLLAVAALVALPLGNADVALRANGDYPLGLAGVGTVRLVETLGALATALLGGGLAAAAAALLGCRLAGTILVFALLRHRAPWVRSRPTNLRWADMRTLLAPSLAALAIPAGLALSLQGMTLVAGLVVSAPAVAVFVACRTLTRTLVQCLGLFNHALMPEAARAAGVRDERQARRLLRLNLGLALALLVPGWAVLVICGPALLRWWTAGALTADPVVFGALATAALLQGGWLSASNLLLAANRHGQYAFHFVAVAVTTCGLAAALGRGLGLPGIAIAAVMGEAAMAIMILPPQIRDAVSPMPNPIGGAP